MEARTRTGLWEQAAAMQSFFISDDGRTLDQLLADDIAPFTNVQGPPVDNGAAHSTKLWTTLRGVTAFAHRLPSSPVFSLHSVRITACP